ncbi:EamA family transporter [Saccharothrix coeruleofusca]|uniref:EamA domain-containing protein n=1 Tax=Saccharothrix coeruleofusca TaxID=33919 RepID=A0A918EHE5_9PSEU|nr:EamA family transporter [Saccharothrix coeruleofusca]GGP78627.1 hypothetical protein GCM10010185_60550 [Saccharothrix coeruleofusca]
MSEPNARLGAPSAAAAGAACIASSATLVELSGAGPITAAVFRCAYALPFLAALAWTERRGWPLLRTRPAVLAGVLFAVDLVCWHFAIAALGADVSTVLVNLQVVLVVLLGVALVSGGGGRVSVAGVLWALAAAAAYAGFLLALGEVSGDPALSATPLAVAAGAAAVCTALTGVLVRQVDFAPHWSAHGWLAAVAVTGQVVGWLLISRSMPRLPPAVTSLTLLLQPVAAVLLAAVVLDGHPTAWQWAGCALVLLGVRIAHRGTAARALVARDRT